MGLVSGLISRGNEATKLNADQPAETVSSTVRFGGDLRRFLEAQADAWGGVSTQAVITTILTGVMNETLAQCRSQVDVIPARILELFTLHRIDIVTAAEILGAPVADMRPERLVNHVSNEFIDRLSDTFNINRGWLLGENSVTRGRRLSWDRSPTCAARRILKRAREGLKPRVLFVKDRAWNLEKALKSGGNGMRMPVVLELTRVTAFGKDFKTYEELEALPWEYERCRTDILALLMFCQNMCSNEHQCIAEKMGLDSHHFLPWGVGLSWHDPEVDHATFEQFTQGQIPASQLFSRPWTTSCLDNFTYSPEEYPKTAKLDRIEFASVIEKHNKAIKNLADEITQDREDSAQKAKWSEDAARERGDPLNETDGA